MKDKEGEDDYGGSGGLTVKRKRTKVEGIVSGVKVGIGWVRQG